MTGLNQGVYSASCVQAPKEAAGPCRIRQQLSLPGIAAACRACCSGFRRQNTFDWGSNTICVTADSKRSNLSASEQQKGTLFWCSFGEGIENGDKYHSLLHGFTCLFACLSVSFVCLFVCSFFFLCVFLEIAQPFHKFQLASETNFLSTNHGSCRSSCLRVMLSDLNLTSFHIFSSWGAGPFSWLNILKVVGMQD